MENWRPQQSSTKIQDKKWLQVDYMRESAPNDKRERAWTKSVKCEVFEKLFSKLIVHFLHQDPDPYSDYNI